VDNRRRKSNTRFTFGMDLDLLPIRENIPAVAKYLEKNFKDAASRKEVQDRDWQPGRVTKGTKLVTYSASLPQPAVIPLTKGYIRFQEKLGVFTYALNTPKEWLHVRFGGGFWYQFIHFLLPMVEEEFGEFGPGNPWPFDQIRKWTLEFFGSADAWARTGPPSGIFEYRSVSASQLKRLSRAARKRRGMPSPPEPTPWPDGPGYDVGMGLGRPLTETGCSDNNGMRRALRARPYEKPAFAE
jgi:hypothetical protein